MHFIDRLLSRLRLVVCLLAASVLAACSTTDTLNTTKRPSVAPLETGNYAAVVIDANSGRTLYAANATEPRYPASLTKMMTLYMLFEALDSGKVSKSSRIPISAYAAARPPSKLRLRAGDSIDVDTAIRALSVKSANDVAAAVGEFLGGTEEQFARMMTAKARQIGMRSTTFRNASGLPDGDQVTTARDMALLGNTLRKRFPSHYAYFDQTSFNFRGKRVTGHNRLLERDGVDGIKTGYIRASGFNVVTSATHRGKRVVVAVMGGKTASIRNAHVEELIAAYLPGWRPSTRVQEAPRAPEPSVTDDDLSYTGPAPNLPGVGREPAAQGSSPQSSMTPAQTLAAPTQSPATIAMPAQAPLPPPAQPGAPAATVGADPAFVLPETAAVPGALY